MTENTQQSMAVMAFFSTPIVDVPAPRLLLFLDSRSPAGAHSHSGGVEVAIAQGLIRDVPTLAKYCGGRLRTSGSVSAAFAATAALAYLDRASAEQWSALDNELEARTPSAAYRAASKALGSGLKRLLRATTSFEEWADLEHSWALLPNPHQPLVLGAGCAALGGSPLLAARSAALNVCSGAASAAVRLLGLDPYAVHRMVAELDGDITALAADVTSTLPFTPGVRPAQQEASWLAASYLASLCSRSAPALEILADLHAQEEMRLFAS